MPNSNTEERFDARYKHVQCHLCNRAYQCVPHDDYYNATNANDGVCEECLLKQMGASYMVVVNNPIDPN